MTSCTRMSGRHAPTIPVVQATTLLLGSGLLVWALVGVRVMASLATGGGTPNALGDFVAWILFLAAFLVHVRSEARPSLDVACLLLQTLAALKLGHSAGTSGMEVALLVMVAGQLPTRFRPGVALWWVLAQTAAAVMLQVMFPRPNHGLSGLGVLLYFGAYLTFQLFALGASELAESESAARMKLAEAQKEVERMHEVAVDAARQAERLRIARDLHDSLGHRLTALGLALEAARHLRGEEAASRVSEAREISTALLLDLRRSVGEIRDDETPELRSLFEGLARSVDTPRVSAEIDPSVRITSPDAATALHRIGQEIVTNAARHSCARSLRLTVRTVGDDVLMEGVDDGGSASMEGIAVAPGNGLTGIRERARLLGGDATFERVQGEGFRVTARFPATRLS